MAIATGVLTRINAPYHLDHDGGAKKMHLRLSFSGATTYTTGGIDLNGTFEAESIRWVDMLEYCQVFGHTGILFPLRGLQGVWVPATQKLKLINQGSATPGIDAEISNGTTLTNIEIDLKIVAFQGGV